jgi:hypothetical protein
MALLSSPISAAAQAAYSELLEVARHDDLSRSVQNLSGSFNRKTVKGSVYWYYQFTDGAGGSTRQIFVGKDSEKLQALVERARAKDTSQVDRLAKSAIALGCASTTPAHFRIVRRLNEIGFFHAGGIMVGAHAFLTYGNALGVSWERLARTQDLDFPHAGRDLDVALPGNLWIDTREAIEHLEAGFLPVPGFRPWDKTATFVSKVDKTLRVDFLTPMVGGKSDVYRHPNLGVNLQPLRFLEFLIEDVQPAVVVSAAGAVLVTVPDPARFALHKLLVHAERRTRSPDKALKDLHQAGALIEVLAEFREDDLKSLWRNILDRGPGWRRRARTAVKALAMVLPEHRLVAAMGKVAATAKTTVSSKNEK